MITTIVSSKYLATGGMISDNPPQIISAFDRHGYVEQLAQAFDALVQNPSINPHRPTWWRYGRDGNAQCRKMIGRR